MRYELCPVAEIPVEGSRVVDFFGRQVHVVQERKGVPVAYLDVCMHLGGPLTYEKGRFECQWHHATFDAANGRRLSGPASQHARLLRLPTKVENGSLIYLYDE